MGIPAQGLSAGNGMNAAGSNAVQRKAAGSDMSQRSQTSKYPTRRDRNLSSQTAEAASGSTADKLPPVDGATQRQAVPIVQNKRASTPVSESQLKRGQATQSERGLMASQVAQAGPAGRLSEARSSETAAQDNGANLTLSDSPIPNPLRSTTGSNPKSAVANSNNPAGPSRQPSAVQTVGYQEEIPIITGEQIPKNPENITRLAMLEEPALAEPTPASVLESGESAPASDPVITESAPAEVVEAGQQLPWDEYEPQQEVPIVQPPGTPAIGNSTNLMSPAASAQGHYQQGTAVYGQVLNEPQQTASQRAIQLLDENQRLREEMKAKLKELENAQSKLKQQDELWARARQEFLEVRGVVDNLTRENSLLKMQIEKLEGEKVELARQYQSLMQTVEQTLDDLLLKAITQPPEGNPPATTPATAPAPPPAAAPATQPPVAPPIVSGQQASALLKSPQ